MLWGAGGAGAFAPDCGRPGGSPLADGNFQGRAALDFGEENRGNERTVHKDVHQGLSSGRVGTGRLGHPAGSAVGLACLWTVGY